MTVLCSVRHLGTTLDSIHDMSVAPRPHSSHGNRKYLEIYPNDLCVAKSPPRATALKCDRIPILKFQFYNGQVNLFLLYHTTLLTLMA